jgi:hypothetical protein
MILFDVASPEINLGRTEVFEINGIHVVETAAVDTQGRYPRLPWLEQRGAKK